MRLHREDFEMLKVIGRGAFGEVRNLAKPRCLFGMFKSAGKSPLNHCSLCHIAWFVFGISKLCFHVPFCVSNENPKLSAKVFMSPSSILSAATNRTPFLPSEFPFSPPCQFPGDLGLALDCYSWAGTNLSILDCSFVLHGNVLLVPAVKHLDYSLHAQCSFLFLYHSVFYHCYIFLFGFFHFLLFTTMELDCSQWKNLSRVMKKHVI